MTNPTQSALDALSEKATQGEWFVDTENSEGEYGIGPDTQSGFLVSVIYGPDGKSLFDPHNSDMIEVHEDYPDEDGYVSAWDETSRRNAAFIVALVNAYRTGHLTVADPAAIAGEVTQADRDLVEAIIADYHTTRLAGSDYVTHILGKPRTQSAFARHRIAAIAAAEARGFERGIREAAEVADMIAAEAERHAGSMRDRTDALGKLWRTQYVGGHEAAFEIKFAILAKLEGGQ